MTEIATEFEIEASGEVEEEVEEVRGRHKPECSCRGVIRVRHQLSRGSATAPAQLVPLKTDSSAREVVLVPALATILREHRAKAMEFGHHAAESYVFSTRTGTPISQRNATRSLARIACAASLQSVGFHTLRHGFASTLDSDCLARRFV